MFPSPLDRLGLQPAMDQTSHRRFMKLLRVRSSFFLFILKVDTLERKKAKNSIL